MTRRARFTASLVVLATLAAPLRAHAALDPERAETQAKAVVQANRAFCKHPSRPLSPAARRFCPLAEDGELDDCEGLVKACAAAASEADDSAKNGSGGSGGKETRQAISQVLANIAQGVVWVLLALAIVAVLVPIAQALLKRRRDKNLAEPTVEEAKPAADDELLAVEPPSEDAEYLLRRADDLARTGRFDAALYMYLHAALRALDLRGAVRIAKYRTHGEYVRSCKEAASRDPLREIALEVDLVRFGGRAATHEAVERAADRAKRVVRMAFAAGAMALTLLLSGCGVRTDSWRGADPAGYEIFTELLTKQGLKVSPLGASLASLPIPDVGGIEGTPAVLINVSGMTLEPEVEKHLREWVEAGGMLILTGDPSRWPFPTAAKTATTTSRNIQAFAPEARTLDAEDDDSDQAGKPLQFRPGRLVAPAGFEWNDEDVVVLATTMDGKVFAAARSMGRGSLLAMASNDLVANAGLAQAHNPAALVAILSSLGRSEIKIAHAEDGIEPPSNPFAGIVRAGLGLPLWHTLAAALLFFVAVGARLARPRTPEPPKRRAFAEHVRATGAFYARTFAAGHALAVFTRYARDRLRAAGSWGSARTLARGGGAAVDPVHVLAQRTGKSIEECGAVWNRATEAVVAEQQGTQPPPRGDELVTLRALSALLSEATRTK